MVSQRGEGASSTWEQRMVFCVWDGGQELTDGTDATLASGDFAFSIGSHLVGVVLALSLNHFFFG
jgi:hypothetical protein